MIDKRKRFFKMWFNHLAMGEPFSYTLRQEKPHYLFTKEIAKRYIEKHGKLKKSLHSYQVLAIYHHETRN
jgi:hypothetical protein